MSSNSVPPTYTQRKQRASLQVCQEGNSACNCQIFFPEYSATIIIGQDRIVCKTVDSICINGQLSGKWVKEQCSLLDELQSLHWSVSKSITTLCTTILTRRNQATPSLGKQRHDLNALQWESLVPPARSTRPPVPELKLVLTQCCQRRSPWFYSLDKY